MGDNIILKNMEFFGKHAKILEKISVTQDNLYKQPPLFDRMLDSVFIAGLIGLICKKKSSIDKSENYKKTIFQDTIFNNLDDINFYTAIPIIIENDLSKTIEVKKALFTDGEEDFTNARYKNFYAYVLGGLEILDEKVLNKDYTHSEIGVFNYLDELLNDILQEDNFNIDPNIDLDIDMDIN